MQRSSKFQGRSQAATMRLKRRMIASLIAASVAASVAAPTAVWAQSVNATVRGDGPPNATVTAFNVATGTTRRTQVNADGHYALVGLPPGTYQIDAGPGTGRTLTLSVASTTSLNFPKNGASKTPSTANATELGAVQVSAINLPEVKTSEVGTTITQQQIQSLPQASRNFLEFADIVPGMQFSVAGTSKNTSLQGGAQSPNGVNVYIDGISQKSYVMGGGIAGQNASQGNPFPQLAIGEYKVITSNYKAEYDQVTSAAVTSVTKSGTNEFHGEVFSRYTSDKFRARTPAENAKNKKTTSQEKEYGVAVGGPIIKDKMHFFFTYEGKRFNSPTAVTPPDTTATAVQYLPADVQAQFGPANNPFQENLYFGKIDWEPTDRDRFELTARVRKEHTNSGIGNGTAASAGVNQINDDKRYALKWAHSADAWYNEMTVSHQSTFFQPTPLNLGNGAIYTYGDANNAQIIDTGPASPLAAQNKGQKGWTFKDDLTLNDLEWAGNHVVKMGVTYRDLTLTAADASDINPQYYYNVTSSGTDSLPYKAFFTKPVTGLGSLAPVVTTKDKQYGAYIQDDWDVTDKLQVNLGIRWDYEDNPSYTGFVTPPNVVAALQGTNPYAVGTPYEGETYAQALARGGINVNDYISNGHQRSNKKNEWQPRLGFSYDMFGDEAHVFHGGWGRSYDRNLYNYLQLETTKSALPQFTVYFQNPNNGQCLNNGTPCYAWDPSYASLAGLQALVQAGNGGEVDLLNNNLKVPYSDQASLGMSNKIGDWQTDVTFTRVQYHNGFAFILGNRYPNGDFFQNHSQPWGDGVPGFGSLILGTNGIETRNNEILVSAQKPYTKQSGWGATFAYTMTNAHQNRSVTEHYSFDYATIQDYPFVTSNAAPKHRIVATGTFSGPWGIVLGAKLTLATPTPLNSNACYFPNAQFPNGVTFDNGSYCHTVAIKPQGQGRFLVGGKIWGYRDVDFQATKNFNVGHGVTMYARFDLINVFNWKNLVDTQTNLTGGPGNEAAVYNTSGNIQYYPRTVKFEIGARF
ncbi:TonB-dependent receptor [Oleiagrimonas citrea]|nr:TonB-dependent receptor [Oleiagrimonas citrea]